MNFVHFLNNFVVQTVRSLDAFKALLPIQTQKKVVILLVRIVERSSWKERNNIRKVTAGILNKFIKIYMSKKNISKDPLCTKGSYAPLWTQLNSGEEFPRHQRINWPTGPNIIRLRSDILQIMQKVKFIIYCFGSKKSTGWTTHRCLMLSVEDPKLPFYRPVPVSVPRPPGRYHL